MRRGVGRVAIMVVDVYEKKERAKRKKKKQTFKGRSFTKDNFIQLLYSYVVVAVCLHIMTTIRCRHVWTTLLMDT